MEVPLIANTVILLLSLPVIHGNGDNLDKSSPRKVYRNQHHIRPIKPFRDTKNNGMQEQYRDDHNMNENVVDILHRLETKIDRISNRNDLDVNDHYVRDVIVRLDTLLEYVKGERHYSGPNSSFDDGRSQIGLIKELLAAVGSADQNLRIVAEEVMKYSRQSMTLLKKLNDIVQDTDTHNPLDEVSSSPSRPCSSVYPKSSENINPIGIDDESPRRSQDNYAYNRKFRDGTVTRETNLDKPIENVYQSPRLQYNTLNHEFNDNEFTGQSIISSTNPTNRVVIESDKSNCDELEIGKNGIYKFASHEEANEGVRLFNERYCDFATNDGVAWTVIQRSFANNRQLSFNRTWLDYKRGFGDLAKEFWFGNDFIHRLTSQIDMELRIIFEEGNMDIDRAEYSLFKIESEEDQYKLLIDGYYGTIPDRLQYLYGQHFSTFDRRNDKNNNVSCGYGWWFKNCTQEALGNWFGSTSMKMMIRPKDVVKPGRSQSNNSTAKSKQHDAYQK